MSFGVDILGHYSWALKTVKIKMSVFLSGSKEVECGGDYLTGGAGCLTTGGDC